MSLTPDTRSRDQLLEDYQDLAQECLKQARRIPELEAENARLHEALREMVEAFANNPGDDLPYEDGEVPVLDRAGHAPQEEEGQAGRTPAEADARADRTGAQVAGRR